MHREIDKRLDKATGYSDHVIAVNLDVRGFTKFSERAESVQAALYLQRLYRALLDDFFANHSFFKPTGDGLMLIFRVDPESLVKECRNVVAASLKAVKRFKRLCRSDPMLNFPMPTQVGIGIARGAATRLVAEDGLTLDYSGRPLNLASRLMDIARPEGVVMDASFRPQDVLTPATLKHFATDAVYLRSIAEATPIRVYFTAGLTEITPGNKRPLDELTWKTVKLQWTFSELQELKRRAPRYVKDLPSRPVDTAQIQARLHYPATTSAGAKHPTLEHLLDLTQGTHFDYFEDAGTPSLALFPSQLLPTLSAAKIKSTWKVRIEVHYPE